MMIFTIVLEVWGQYTGNGEIQAYKDYNTEAIVDDFTAICNDNKDR